jgi:sugar phosphate isomerase/epimerase
MKKSRRNFLKYSGQVALGVSLFGLGACGADGDGSAEGETKMTATSDTENTSPSNAMFFGISLAQWSLHKMLGNRGEAKMNNLEFAAMARNEFDIGAVEYVNQFFKDKAKDMAYLKQMNQRAADNDVKQLLIMIDDEGGLAEVDNKERMKAIENHYKWVEAAKFLGCHSIRVNAASQSKDMEGAAKAAVEGLGKLSEYAKPYGINVIVENHGGYSSNAAWLSGVMDQINMENCGTLPDFGNFCIREEDDECVEEYDRYKGVKELMKHAKAVSAKTHDFNAQGEEVHTDYMKMMKIVKDAGYTGYVGIEYEGSELGEIEGIKATKALLEKVGKALS